MITIIRATQCQHVCRLVSRYPIVNRLIETCPDCLSRVGRPPHQAATFQPLPLPTWRRKTVRTK